MQDVCSEVAVVNLVIKQTLRVTLGLTLIDTCADGTQGKQRRARPWVLEAHAGSRLPRQTGLGVVSWSAALLDLPAWCWSEGHLPAAGCVASLAVESRFLQKGGKCWRRPSKSGEEATEKPLGNLSQPRGGLSLDFDGWLVAEWG